MATKSYDRELVSSALGWAGLLVGLASVIPVITQHQTSSIFWILLGAGVTVLLLALLVRASPTAFDYLVRLAGGNSTIICTCPEEHVTRVHELAAAFFGAEVTEPDKIREITHKYRDGLQIALGRTASGDVSVKGYYFLFPINKRCVDRIMDYSFNVSTLSAADIATKPRYGHAIYIGGIAAKGFLARAELLGAIKANYEKARQTKSKTVYARAATERGKSLLLQNGFQPVHPEADSIRCFFKKQFI